MVGPDVLRGQVTVEARSSKQDTVAKKKKGKGGRR